MAVNVEGASPPVFEEIFRNARFAQGGNALFEGKVKGNPKPQVIWTRKGLQMKGSEKHQMMYDEESGKVSLLIKGIGPGDEGEYTCTALNPYGEAICTVYISPEATKAVKKSRSGQKLHKSSSNKQMVQQQQQHTQQLQQQQHHQTQQQYQQQFKMQSTNMAHQQQVQPPQQQQNVLQQQQNLVQQQQQQNLVQQQQQQNLVQQQQYSMMQQKSSSSSFHQSASYSSQQAQMSSSNQQFSSSQQQMSSSQQSASYNQFGVQQQQTIPENEPEVIYLKHVERSQPHKKPAEMEQKFGAPAFVTPIRDLTVNEGDKIHFDAKISPVGDPSLCVEWFFNGNPIPASSRMNSTCQFGFVSLDMLNSLTSDIGEYTCVIKNEIGSVHCSAQLIVRPRKELETEFRSATQHMEQQIASSTVVQEIREPPPPVPEFVKPLDGVGEKVEGSNVHLEAQINPVSDNTMKIEWFKDGKPITASSRIGTIFNFGYVSLNINGVRAEDAGTYTCRATNISGEAVTNSTLQVKITQDLTASTGIIEQQQYIEKVQKLEEYQSSKSMKRMESVVEPSSAPEFKTQLKDQVDIREGGFAHFEARLEPMGDHTMRVEWMKDGQPVEASSRITSFFNFGYVALTIKQVTALDAGRYVCIAYNAKGRVETSANLNTSSKVDPEFQSKSWSSIQQLETNKTSTSTTVSQSEATSAPQFVSQLKGTNIILEGQRAHFECRIEPQNDANLKVEWLHNGQTISASSRIQTFYDFGFVAIDILDVRKQDAGVYTLIVMNALGELRNDVELRVDVHADVVDQSTIHARTVEETKKFEMRQQKTVINQGTEVLCTSAPVFRTPLQNPQPVLEGQNIHLEARLEPIGDSTMKVEWFFNERSLTVGSRFKTYNDFGFIALDIIGVNAQDEGVYTCRAVNQLGSAHTSANVQVHIKSNIITETENEASLQQINYLESSEKFQQRVVEENEPKQAPNFVKNLHNVEIVEGKNIHLEGRLLPTGDSTMQVEWTFNGKPLKSGHKIRPAFDFDYVALDLLSVYPEDSGVYTCTARNAYGEAQTSATVKIAPTIDIGMDAKTAQNLQRLNLLEQRSAARLSHKHADLEEGLDQFLESPRFVTQPKNVSNIAEGKNAHFEAKLEPITDPNLSVEWFKNGEPITIGHRFRPIHDFGYVALDIVGLISEDSGTYTCRATNLAGSCECQATLSCKSGQQIISESSNELSQFEMLEQRRMTSKHHMEEEATTQAPVFTTSMKSVEIKEGQRAHFECRIIPVSDPTLQIQWLLNNQPIKQASRIKEGLDFGFVSLDIMQAHPDDAGTYTCRAVNKLGEAVNSASLVVKAKETIIKDTLHEAAMSQIHHLEHAHVAQTQEEGLTTQTPSFTSVMKDLVLLEGTSAHFEAKLVPIGDPKLRVDWLLNGKPIQASNRMSTLHDFGFVAFDLKYTRPEDSGTYTCRAVNALGETTTSASMQIISAQNGPMGETMHEDALHKIASLEQKKHVSHIMEDDSVQSAPVFVVPLQGKHDLIEGQNIHMECRIEPYPDPSLKVEWFHNGKSLPFGNRWKTSYDFGFAALDILGCYPEDSGTYTLRATNALGMTESHLDVKVSSRSGLLLDSEHADALEKIRYLESKRRRADDEEIIITEAPQFGHVLKDLNLEEGQPAHFETTLTPVNDANMKVEWHCNGKPIPQGHRFRTTYDFGFVALDILYAYPEDNGNYTCVAKNAIGEDSISCSLSVQGKASLLLDTMDRDRLTHLRNLEHKPDYRPVEGDVQYSKPVFTTPLNNADNVPEQAHVHLECRLEPVNDPNLRVEWFVGGKAIRTGHRFRMTHDFGYVALDILYAYPEDSGTYMCKASNRLGEAVNTCSVSVVGKQSLLLDSQHAESWQKIQHLESRGHQSKLQVIETPSGPPRFVTELMGKTTLSEGQSAHFEAQVEPVHDPSLKIEFIHNGKPLQQASRIHTLCDFGYVALDIAQLIVEDAGEYICRIYNSHGEVRSKVNLSISGKDSLDVSSQRPEGLEKIKELERQKQRENREELVTFQKPVFTQGLLNVEKEESQNAHMEARLIPIGDPSLRVEWFKDGQKISTGSRINTLHDFGFVSLDITGLRESDVGVYECRAVNSLGEANTSATIKVASKGSLILDSQHPEGMRKITALESSKLKHQISEQEAKFERPTFVATLTGTPEVLEGQRAHMECRVVPLGDPNLKFTWFKNGEHLKTGSRIQATQDFGYVTLDIDSCIPEDSGMYTIKAENFAGEASTSFALRIGDKSGIMGDALQPDSLKRIEQLEAQKNQKKKSVEEASIAQPPVFMSPLKDIGSIAEAQNVHVEASIEPKNDPDMRVEWEFNGTSLSCGSRIKTTLDFGHVQLYINGVRGSDSGLYTCKAINKLGEAVSTTQIKVEETNASDHATVDVKDPPKFVTHITEKISISEGQSAHFEAKLSPAEDPNLTVEWFKDGKPLPTGHRFRTFHDFGIVILDILYTYEEDHGVYECRAKNNFGSDVTKGTIECSAKSNLILTPQIPGEMRESTMEHISHLESSLKCQHRSSSKSSVGSAPRFTVPIHNIDDLKEAESAHFEARVSPTDDPNLTIEWYWNGKALKAGSRIRTFCDFGFVILEISPVYPEDSGEYMCKARNSLGEAVTTATLKCSGKRNLIMDSQLPKGMEGAIDKIAHLEGLGKARDAPVVSDDLGNPPEFLVNLQDLLLAENSLAHFETRITPVNDPSMRVEWYHNGKQLSAGSRIKTINDFGFVILEVANVLTRDSGNYTCKATNKHGESSVSCNVTVKSKQSIITDPQLPRTFRSGTESIQKLEERRWKRGEGPLPEEAPGHAPKFVTKIKDVKLIEGQAAHFDCRVEPVGDGSMKIEWFHEDNPLCIGSRIHTLSDFGFIVLDIDWTFKRDSGTYICRASNKFGVAESRANLQVKSLKDINLDSQLPPGMSMDRLKELEKGKVHSRVEEETEITVPKFIIQLESRAVGEGEPAHFNCRVEPKHDPKLEVKWYFNGKELSSGHRFRITHEFGYVALDILYAYPEDEGEYVCKATNALGEDITKCTLKCKQLPAIQLEQQAPKGMKKSDYFVQMEASMQKYSQDMRLTEDDVYDAEKRQPPRFVTLIKSITDLMEMQAAKFECQLAPVGDPNMKVEWFFNGKPLPFKNRFTPIYDFGYVAMNFGWVYPEDSGEYVCKATNMYGMDETRAIIKTSGKPGIILESQLPKGMESIERIREMESGWQRAPELIDSETEKFKPCFVTKPEPQEVQEGDWARFCCRVTGYPKPRVMWLLNGHTVINGSKHKLVYDGMWHFDIPKCRDIDAGKVEVIARNQCGESYALTNLTVKPREDDFRGVLKHNVKRDYVNSKEYRKPEWVTRMEEIQKRLSEQQQSAKFTQEIKEVRIKEGMKAKFEATFAGNPKPEITWYFNSEPLKNTKNTQIKIKEIKTTLTLIDCTGEMAGFYTCKARNPLGGDSTRAGLTVNKLAGGQAVPTPASASLKSISSVDSEEKLAQKQKKKEEKKQKLEEVKAKAQKEIKAEKVTPNWKKSTSTTASKVVEKKAEEKINFSKVALKKSAPQDKPAQAPKPEPVQLKPTPPKPRQAEESKPEKVELKPVPKKTVTEEISETDKKKAPSTAPKELKEVQKSDSEYQTSDLTSSVQHVEKSSDNVDRPLEKEEDLKPKTSQKEKEPKEEPEPVPRIEEPEPVIKESKKEPEPIPTIKEPKNEPDAIPTIKEPKKESEPVPIVEEPKKKPEPAPIIKESKKEPEPVPTIEEPKKEPEPVPTIKESKKEPEPVSSVKQPKKKPETAPTIKEPKKEPEPAPIVEEPKPEPVPTIKESKKEPEPVPIVEETKNEPEPVPIVVEEPKKEPEPVPIVKEPKPVPIVQEPEPVPIVEEPKDPEPIIEEPQELEPEPIVEEPQELEPELTSEEPKGPEPIIEEPKEVRNIPIIKETKETIVEESVSIVEEPKEAEPVPIIEEPEEPKVEEPESPQSESVVKKEILVDEKDGEEKKEVKKVKKVVKKVKEGSKEVSSEDKTKKVVKKVKKVVKTEEVVVSSADESVKPDDSSRPATEEKTTASQVVTEAHTSKETSGVVVSEAYKGPMKAIADIALRLEHGASVEEVNAAFEAHEFPELENLGSQMAMIKVVDRVGHSALINQVLLQEKATEVQEKGRKLSSVIGFKALMSTLIHEPYKTEEVITSFNPKDFSKEDVALEEYAKLVHSSKELEIAQASEISTEIKESIDAEVKTASSTEIKSEMVVHDVSKSSSTKVTTVQSGEAVQISSSLTDVTKLSIKEGDVFFALATFVSDTGEAMNLVEGEKVHVLEWNNNDWWYVRKHITEESGWVPAQYLKDEQTYTRYVHKKLVEKIEKLPVFEQPKTGENTFAPKIITKVKAMAAVDGCQVEFTCQIEGSPRPQITWFRQTAIIKPSQDFQISYADDNVATLVIKEVFPEDAGTFTCVAKNCVGYASSSADLMVERPLSDHGGVDKHDRRSLSRESSLADIVEGIPPTFAQRPQTKNVEEGSNTELECRFVAIPEAEVRWFHNKVELKDNERLTIHHQADMHMYCSIIRISCTRAEDSGTYEVLAKNREGESSNTLILNVNPKAVSQQPPMIVKPLTPTICKIGDSVKMEAVITGKPKPSINWFFNGAPLNTNDSNIKLTDKENIYALTITKVTQSHDGDFRIKVENEFGSAQTQANICIQGQEISFIKPLEDVEIKECTSYEMTVEISDENATIIWQKDGQEIKPSDSQYEFKTEGRKRSLKINSSTVHHEGEYVASVGDQECSCELTVIELPPEFVKSLSPCKVTSGEMGVFEIELSKGDAVTRWFRQGIEIEFNQRIQLIIDGKKQRLEINSADKKDAGEYSVTVGDKSCTALLIVQEPNVSFVGKLKKVTTGNMGQSVKLTVKLSKSDANVKWLKDGQEISEGPHYSFEVDGDVRTLIIDSAVLSDVASYTCMAENITTVTDVELMGGDQKLIIMETEISKQQEMMFTRGQDITLNIPFEETSQKPAVKWLFQGKEIKQSEKIQMKVTRRFVSITIKHAQSVDCGVYTAKLSNSVSEISMDFVVRIKDKPTPPRGPAMVEWKSDDFMELHWNIPESDGGSAILEYIVERKEESKKSWKQVGISTNTKMEIRGLGKSVSYNFRIIARNEVGLSEAFIVEETFSAASSTLAGSKKSLPGSPNVQVTDVTSKSVTLQWSPPLHNGGAELIEYVLEKKISTSHSWERAATVDPSVTLFTIENLKEKCQYYFRISAVNEVGAGEPTSTEIVSLRTHARPPSTPTAPLEIHSVGPTAIIVEWGAPESDGGAPLEGYKIAVRDAKRHMWMEVGRVKADTQKLKVQDLAEGHQYFIRIFAKNEVGFSDPLENEEAVKVVRPADYKEEEPEEKDKMDDTPSLSFSTTETLSSWMREAHMDADIQSYTTSSSLRRDEYFFRIWYYAQKLFK